MSQTDSPLKEYLRENVIDIASWLLGREVISAEHHPVELPRADFKADAVFFLQLASGEHCLFHVEFQGRRTRTPMKRRLLNYLTLLALGNEWPLLIESFVVYVEEYAGTKDNGQYALKRLDGSNALAWNYTPIHLWRESAETLLEVDRPAILPFAGLMKISSPATIVPELVDRINAVEDLKRRENLFKSLIALMDDEEVDRMITGLIESDELLVNTPFMVRTRLKGARETLHRNILKIIAERFNPPIKRYKELEFTIKAIEDVNVLDELFDVALLAVDLDVVQAFIDDIEDEDEEDAEDDSE